MIVNWNTGTLLARCLDSVFADAAGLDLEVFIVDNASTDHSLDIVRAQFKQVKLIENRVNNGFARANNQALQQCTGRYCMLLNPDTVVKPGAIGTLISYMEKHPGVGATGPMMLNPDNSLQFSCSPAPTLRRETRRLLHFPGVRGDGYYPMDRWDTVTPHKVDILLGACILLRHEVLESIGLLDEAYFMYTEEVDLCYRVGKAGWEIVWVPLAQVIHYGGQSTQQASAEMFLHLYGSKMIFFRKHQGKLAARYYKLLLGLTSITRLFAAPFSLFGEPGRRQYHKRLLGNYLRLLTSLPDM